MPALSLNVLPEIPRIFAISFTNAAIQQGHRREFRESSPHILPLPTERRSSRVGSGAAPRIQRILAFPLDKTSLDPNDGSLALSGRRVRPSGFGGSLEEVPVSNERKLPLADQEPDSSPPGVFTRIRGFVSNISAVRARRPTCLAPMYCWE